MRISDWSSDVCFSDLLEFRAVTNSKHPVEKPEDLNGLKLRVPSSAAIKGFFEAAGAQPVIMPFPELFTALQQGTVDGHDNGASPTYAARRSEERRVGKECDSTIKSRRSPVQYK